MIKYLKLPLKRGNFLWLTFLFLPVFLEAQESSLNSKIDWHVGASWSPLYTGLYSDIWNTVGYLAILQREGSSMEEDYGFASGAFGGVGWVFKNDNKMRMAVGGEYELSYFRIASTYTFGEQGPFGSSVYVPAEGSQQQLLLEGLEHRIGPYYKISFLTAPLPIDVQFTVSAVFSHLLSMKLRDYDGENYQVTALDPNSSVGLTGPSGTFNLYFGLRNTVQAALAAGIKVYVGSFFIGADYSTNVVDNSFRVQVGFAFKNNFFSDAWN
jgi:hypothetical protein